MSRASSPTPVRSSIWNGSGADALSTSSSAVTTSMSPVGRSGLALPAGRGATSPMIFTQYSLRRSCAPDASSTSSRTTTCTTPEASRRSTNATPP